MALTREAAQVRAEVAREDLELAVIDHGVGIDEVDLPYIFDRFHQATEVLTRETPGAGLGLYITKRLVEALGGSIHVESSPGRGSTFIVRLPLGPRESARPGEAVGVAPSPLGG